MSDEEEEGGGSRSSESRSRHHLRNDSRTPSYDNGGRQLEIPVFNGDEVYGWIVNIERYFKMNAVREEERLDAVVLALEDLALNWYQWWEEQATSFDWEEFKDTVLRRFQPGLAQNPFGPLLSIKKTGMVMEYRDRFELVSAPLKGAE